MAFYSYDALGNLTRIDRIDAASLPGPVAIAAVIPNKGRRGTTVSILGKGFGATPAQNAVTFNGSAATVTSAAPFRLVVAVPSGATTGLVAVTAPLGSATSPTPFRVVGPITVSPASKTLFVNANQQFSASDSEGPTTNILWTVNGVPGGDTVIGTISTSGLYVAPAIAPASRTVTIGAISRDDPTFTASASVTIQPPIPFFAATPPLSVAVAGPAFVSDRSVTTSVSVAVAARDSAANAAAVSVRVAETAVALVPEVPVAVGVAPVVTAVVPATGARGATQLVTLRGSGFTGATALQILRDNAADSTITVTDLTVNGDGTEATATFSIQSGALTGGRVLRLVTPGGVSTAVGTTTNVFTVQ